MRLLTAGSVEVASRMLPPPRRKHLVRAWRLDGQSDFNHYFDCTDPDAYPFRLCAGDGSQVAQDLGEESGSPLSTVNA